jgi:hypothetical protein
MFFGLIGEKSDEANMMIEHMDGSPRVIIIGAGYLSVLWKLDEF